jgi:hypothetical protein
LVSRGLARHWDRECYDRRFNFGRDGNGHDPDDDRADPPKPVLSPKPLPPPQATPTEADLWEAGSWAGFDAYLEFRLG